MATHVITVIVVSGVIGQILIPGDSVSCVSEVFGPIVILDIWLPM